MSVPIGTSWLSNQGLQRKATLPMPQKKTTRWLESYGKESWEATQEPLSNLEVSKNHDRFRKCQNTCFCYFLDDVEAEQRLLSSPYNVYFQYESAADFMQSYPCKIMMLPQTYRYFFRYPYLEEKAIIPGWPRNKILILISVHNIGHMAWPKTLPCKNCWTIEYF